MTSVPSRILSSARRIYQTTLGKRLSRFVPVAVVAFVVTQLTLALLLGVAGVTAGTAGVLAAATGAAVSYLLSRWAWERKGRPNLVTETLPFWAVSVGAWVVLGLASHFASVWAHGMGLQGWERVGFVQGAYFVANVGTFLARFVIFHYVLFAERGAGKQGPAVAASPVLAPRASHAGPEQAAGELSAVAVRFPANGSTGSMASADANGHIPVGAPGSVRVDARGNGSAAREQGKTASTAAGAAEDPVPGPPFWG
jgi:putative flippase GtrA